MTSVRARAGIAAILVVALLHPASESHALVQELVRTGVSGLVDGLPAFGDPTFMWTTTPLCHDFGQAGDETRPALITRASLTIASPRAIFSYNPPRAVGVCNPYRLLSNVYAFGADLYYIDNLGDGGRPALWRRPRAANPNDPSQFLSFVGNSVTSAQILVFGFSVMAILENTNPLLQPSVLVQYHKDAGTILNGSLDFGNSGALSSLRYDGGRYLYWLKSGALRRNDTTIGETVTALNGPIQSLYVYPYDEDCDGATCEPLSRVIYSQGNQIIEVETVSNQAFPVYTSPDPNGRISGIERGPVHYYFIERRPLGATLNVEYRFYRQSIGLGTPDLILGPITGSDAGYDGFRSDDTWLYFHERATGRLLRLSTFESAIPIRDLRATGLEVTQGLQNSANALRLIEEKQTIVRFYVRSGNGTDVAGVTASLAGSNDNGFLGRLEPINTLGKTITVRANPTRTNLSHDFQFELPLYWTTGGRLQLSGTVNPSGLQIEEVVTDNGFTRQVDFSESERLVVYYYNWSYDLAGTRYTPSAAELTASRRQMRRLYPLGVPDFDLDTPGLHIIDLNVVDNNLTPQVTRTDPDCVKRHSDANDRNLCASEYVHGRMMTLRQSSNIAAAAVTYGNIPQAPAPMGLNYFTRGYANGQIGSGPSNDNNYASHEVGHILQRAHPFWGAACGHSPDDMDYPYIGSWIDDIPSNAETRFQGLDFSDGAMKALGLLDAASTFDTMSYCSPNWISDYTFEGMYQYLISEARPRLAELAPRQAVAGDWLLLSGIVDPADQEGGFTIVQRVGSVMDATPPAAGAFTLELRNGVGGVLASHSFAANPIDERPGTLAFDLVVRFVPGTTELRVIENATRRVLADAAISSNPPSVSDVQLPGAPDPVDGIVMVTWNASDDDGDDLRFDVFATGDGGTTYRPIHLGIEDTQVALDTLLLGGGPTRLRIVASDGAHTAYAESRTFTARARAPKVVITSPADGARIDWGQLVTLQADIDDLQDAGIPDGQISWSSSALAGAFATGRLVQTDQLPVGEQVLEVRVANSLGAVATASITVVVGDLLTIPAPSLSIAPQHIAWHVAAGDTTPQVRTITVENASEGTLRFDISSDAPWLLIDSQMAITDAVAPQTFTVVTTPMMVPVGVASRGSLTFVNRDDPDDVVVVPVELSRGNVFDRTGDEPPAECAGDCDASGEVAVSELVRGVNISLGSTPLSACSAFDRDADGQVKVNELVLAVRAALSGC